jgi:hypothetical protein
MPTRVEARRSVGVLVPASGFDGGWSDGVSGACGVPEAAWSVLDADWPVPSAGAGSGALAIAAEAAPWDVGCGEAAGASLAGAGGPSDWLQEEAAKPSAAQMSGRKILIMGAL